MCGPSNVTAFRIMVQFILSVLIQSCTAVLKILLIVPHVVQILSALAPHQRHDAPCLLRHSDIATSQRRNVAPLLKMIPFQFYLPFVYLYYLSLSNNNIISNVHIIDLFFCAAFLKLPLRWGSQVSFRLDFSFAR